MDYQDAKEEAKSRLEDLLAEKGINPRKAFRCLNPKHEDKHPSMTYYKKGNRLVCHCGAKYDALDVIGLDNGWTVDEAGIDPARFNDALKEACRRFNIPLDDPSPKGFKETWSRKVAERKEAEAAQDPKEDEEERKKAEQTHRIIEEAKANIEAPEAVEYLKRRGLSLETAKAYGLGYSESYWSHEGKWRALIIPTSEEGLVARNLDSDEKGSKTSKRGSVQPFNMKAIHEAEAVHVVEGEIDALSVLEAGGQAIGLGSASYADIFIEALKQAHRIASKPLKCKTLILSLDNDAAGMEAAQKIRDGIREMREADSSFGIRLKAVNISGSYKDPNEAWTEDPEGFREALRKRATDTEIEAYEKTSAGARLLDFLNGVKASADTPSIPTGFELLDKELDGGLYEGLYIFAGGTSTGKTTLILQMADNIAKQGRDVLYISLEMAETELIAKSLSRLTFEITARKDINRSYCKTVRGITDGKRYRHYLKEEMNLIGEAYNEYSKYAKHLYFLEGMGDIGAEEIRKAVQRHADVTGSLPVLIVDYVQILAPADIKATDKQNMDKAALELKRLSRDFKIPVAVISSINRQNYGKDLGEEALKESGALEYGCDVAIGLQLQGTGKGKTKSREWIEDHMMQDPRGMEAKVLKNRNGRRGGRVYFDYYPKFNLYHEQEAPRIAEDFEEDEE